MVQTSDKFYLNDFPLRANKAIIVTSFDGHLIFLKEALKKYMETGAYVICSYDYHGVMPPNDVMEIPHSFVFKHKTYGAEKRIGWLWDIAYAGGVLSNLNNIEVIFTANSDCVWNKPDGINEVIKFLGKDCDMMASSSTSTIHTASMMFKAHVFHEFSKFIVEYLKNNVPESYSPELIIQKFVRHNNIKNVPPSLQAIYPDGHLHQNQIDHYSSYAQDSTWKQILGFRNLGGEHKWSCLEHLEPVNKRYLDLRDKGIFLSQHEKTTLYNYYMTNDRRWLYMYWDQGEDSWYNRKYFKLNNYGHEPLYNDDKRKELGPDSERKGIFNRFDLDFVNKE